jgi:hypothetical protein
MAAPYPPYPPSTPQTDHEPPLSTLVSEATRDLSTLVRAQVELAKAELQQQAQSGATGGVLLVLAAVLSGLAVYMLCFAGAYGLVRAGLPVWAAFLVVAAVLATIAGVLVLFGRSRLSKMSGPQRASAAWRETVETLKRRGR